MNGEGPKQQGGTIVLQYWHVVVILIVQLIGLGIAWGTLTQQEADISRRLTALESLNEQFVSRSEFEAWRQGFRESVDKVQQEMRDLMMREMQKK